MVPLCFSHIGALTDMEYDLFSSAKFGHMTLTRSQMRTLTFKGIYAHISTLFDEKHDAAKIMLLAFLVQK